MTEETRDKLNRLIRSCDANAPVTIVATYDADGRFLYSEEILNDAVPWPQKDTGPATDSDPPIIV